MDCRIRMSACLPQEKQIISTFETLGLSAVILRDMDAFYWQSKQLKMTNILRMLDLQIGCDVTFLVGPVRYVIAAHKCVLVRKSSVLKAMLTGQLADDRHIHLPDIEKNVFMKFLRYMYTNDIDITADDVVSLIYVGRKYFTDGLVDACTRFLLTHVTDENVLDALRLAETFNLPTVYQHGIMFMKTSLHTVSKSDEFNNMEMEDLVQIIRALDLQMSPTYVAICLQKWCSAECVRRHLPEFDELFLSNIASELSLTPVSAVLFINRFKHAFSG